MGRVVVLRAEVEEYFTVGPTRVPNRSASQPFTSAPPVFLVAIEEDAFPGTDATGVPVGLGPDHRDLGFNSGVGEHLLPDLRRFLVTWDTCRNIAAEHGDIQTVGIQPRQCGSRKSKNQRICCSLE